jgi:hypothetical protein
MQFAVVRESEIGANAMCGHVRLSAAIGDERPHLGNCKTDSIEPCGHLTGEWIKSLRFLLTGPRELDILRAILAP